MAVMINELGDLGITVKGVIPQTIEEILVSPFTSSGNYRLGNINGKATVTLPGKDGKSYELTVNVSGFITVNPDNIKEVAAATSEIDVTAALLAAKAAKLRLKEGKGK